MDSKTELCEIAIKHQSDRTPWLGGHAYTPFYWELLRDRRDIKKVLEIGIDQGRGLRMWRDYFPLAQIYALDIQTNLLINEERIQSFHCDLGDRNSILAAASLIGRDFDFIVDDGSHVPEHQVEVAKILVPHLVPDGIYVIEDVWNPEYVISQLPYVCHMKEFHVNQLSLDDDRLIIIRKGRV